MKKLSELNDDLWLFSERTDELEKVRSVRWYVEHREENLGTYHTVSFKDGERLSLVELVDIEN